MVDGLLLENAILLKEIEYDRTADIFYVYIELYPKYSAYSYVPLPLPFVCTRTYC